MYYHIRLDKQGHVNPKQGFGVIRKDFRSLESMLAWMQMEFGQWSNGWAIDCVGKTETNALMLLSDLKQLVGNANPDIYMLINQKCPDYNLCRAYCFFVSENTGEPPSGFSFTAEYESSIVSSMVETIPNVKQSLFDILQSFDIAEKFDFVGKAYEAILDFYVTEKDIPLVIRQIKHKNHLNPEDYIALADMCQFLDEEQLAARLYAESYFSEGEANWRGKSLVKLADLYMNSEWPKNGGREWDVMKAVDLLTEALTLGCVKEARDTLEGMREQLFEEFEDEPDVDYFIRNYQADALCLAAFCLCVEIGWEKDVPSGTRLYEAALAQGYERAAYYLKEIHRGRI